MGSTKHGMIRHTGPTVGVAAKYGVVVGAAAKRREMRKMGNWCQKSESVNSLPNEGDGGVRRVGDPVVLEHRVHLYANVATADDGMPLGNATAQIGLGIFCRVLYSCRTKYFDSKRSGFVFLTLTI